MWNCAMIQDVYQDRLRGAFDSKACAVPQFHVWLKAPGCWCKTRAVLVDAQALAIGGFAFPMDNMPLLKRCTKCGREIPATTEYFRRHESGQYCLYSICRDCDRAYQQTPEYKAYKKAYDKAYRQTPERKAKNKAYYQTPEYKASEQSRRQTPERRNWTKTYDKSKRQTPEYKAYHKAYAQTTKCKASKRAYHQTLIGRAVAKASRHRRRARLQNLPNTLTATEWQYALDYFGGCCAVCGRPLGLWHTLVPDHWIPLANPNCPGTVAANIVPLCNGQDGCNQSKRDKDAHEWLVETYGKKRARIILSKIADYFNSLKDGDK